MPTSTNKIKNKSKWAYLFPESFCSRGYLQPPFFPLLITTPPATQIPVSLQTSTVDVTICWVVFFPLRGKRSVLFKKEKNYNYIAINVDKVHNLSLQTQQSQSSQGLSLFSNRVCHYRPANYIPPERNDALISSFMEYYWRENERRAG